jgi:Domain of unknown function (DUF4340)
MRGLTSTLILVLVLAGLGGYIYFVDNNRAEPGIDGGAAKTKVFNVEADKIEELRLTYNGESSLLRKVDGAWKMIEPVAADADNTEASGLATSIAQLEVNRTLDDNPKDLAGYGLAKPPMEVTFKAGSVTGQLAIGDKTPTMGDIYAMKPDEKKVFLISSFQESNFNRKPFDLRDKKILKFDRDKADSLAMTRGTETVELARDGSEWKMVKPVAARSDYSGIEGMLGRLSSSNMAKLVEDNATDLAKYGLDKPSMTLAIGTGSARTTLLVGKTESDDMYAKDGSRPVVFTLDPALRDDLKKGLADFRKKEFFEFRPFSVDRLHIVGAAPGGPKVYGFEKVKAAKPGDNDVWKVTPQGGAAHDVEQAAMDDLLTKLSGLKAESFVDAKTKTGLDKPEVVVEASYDAGKFERVRIGKVGTDAFGARDGEAGAGKIATMSMADVLKAIDTAVAPPAPPAPPAPASSTPPAKKQ